MNAESERLREQLAAVEHERWAHWQRYLHSCCDRNADGSLTIPAEKVARWERQIETPYAELSDREKESDRAEVERYWPLVADVIGRLEHDLDEAQVRSIVARNPGIDEDEVRRLRGSRVGLIASGAWPPPCADGTSVHDFQGQSTCPACGWAGLEPPVVRAETTMNAESR